MSDISFCLCCGKETDVLLDDLCEICYEKLYNPYEGRDIYQRR